MHGHPELLAASNALFLDFRCFLGGYGLLRNRHAAPVRGDVVVARFGDCGNHTWQSDLEGDHALGAAAIAWN